MDKWFLGGYVKVIGKIFLDSLKPLVVVVVLLLGFVMAFRNRAHFKGGEEKYYSSFNKEKYNSSLNKETYNSSFNKVDIFNGSFAHSLPLIYSMMAGNHQVKDMGVDEIHKMTSKDLFNFIMCLFFLFVISTLAFNIFTGIAIDEIRNLIADSNIQITKEKISYVYENSILEMKWVNRLYEWFREHVYPIVYWIRDSFSHVKDICLDIICGKSKQVDDVNRNKDSQDITEAFEDDKYSEHFETLEETIKNKNENIEKKIDQLIESMAKLANEQKEQKESMENLANKLQNLSLS